MKVKWPEFPQVGVYHIYEIRFPGSIEAVYVGVTSTGVEDRIRAHIFRSHNRAVRAAFERAGEHSVDWWMKHNVRILARFNSRADAEAYERFRINERFARGELVLNKSGVSPVYQWCLRNAPPEA